MKLSKVFSLASMSLTSSCYLEHAIVMSLTHVSTAHHTRPGVPFLILHEPSVRNVIVLGLDNLIDHEVDRVPSHTLRRIFYANAAAPVIYTQ